MQRHFAYTVCILALGSLGFRVQGQTFNKRYDTYGNSLGQSAWAVEKAPMGYMVFISTLDHDSTFYFVSVAAMHLNVQGQVLSEHRVRRPWVSLFAGWANSADRTADGGYVVGGGQQDTANMHRPTIMRFDVNGDSLWLHNYGIEGEVWIGRQAKQTPDGGFVLCGETNSTGVVDGFLIKTDSLGNEEWTRTYGGGGGDFVVAIDTIGSSYFMGGQYAQGSNDQLWVQRLDSMGNVIWQRIWGSEFSEPNANILTTSDGNCMVASLWGYAAEFGFTNPYLAKLSSTDGSIIWERQYHPGGYITYFIVAKEISTGGFIAVGESHTDGYMKGLMVRTTANGDSLWSRNYQYYDSLMSDGKGTFRDVMPTDDGGFIAAGEVFNSASGNNPPGYNQDVWVVKVDSLGCIEPGCNEISTITTQITNYTNALGLAPNPASDHVRISWQLPGAFKTGPAQLHITSAQGGLVRSTSIDLSRQGLDLVVRDLSAGIYHVHLVQDGTWITGGKLVVE